MHVYEEVMGLEDKIEENIEPEVVENVEQLSESSGVTVEALEEMLEKINNAKELTPDQLIQKEMVKEMLAKKRVTERVRNPQKEED